MLWNAMTGALQVPCLLLNKCDGMGMDSSVDVSGYIFHECRLLSSLICYSLLG